MRIAKIFNMGKLAGKLTEIEKGKEYTFTYDEQYIGIPISLTMPLNQKEYSFSEFPPFFDGLLPEGNQLEGLIRYTKSDRNDHFSHLLFVGNDMVGSITVESDE